MVSRSKVSKKTSSKASFSAFLELPGAVFVGHVNDDDLEHAAFWQRIRHRYECTGSVEGIWRELSEIGLDYDRIEAAVLNPAILTNFTYGMPARHAATV